MHLFNNNNNNKMLYYYDILFKDYFSAFSVVCCQVVNSDSYLYERLVAGGSMSNSSMHSAGMANII